MKYLIPAIVFFLSGVCLAQKPVEKTLLWKIQAKGDMAPSYLYGTHHLACHNNLVVDPLLKQAFQHTSQLYLEIDLTDSAAYLQMMAQMFMPNKQSLSDLLSKKDYDSVATLFQAKTGMSLTLLKNTKPFILASLLEAAVMNCKVEGWEQVFMAMAKEEHKKVKGLETASFQMSMFDSIPYQDQAKSLMNSLYHFDSLQIANNEMTAMYQSRDLDKMVEEVISDKEMEKYAPLLLYNRNANWIPIIEQQIKQQATFFAVGAGHLGGNKGVIALLRKKGYDVTPVFY